MRRFFSFSTTLLLALISLMNCVQSNNHSRQPVTSIQFEPQKRNFRLGEEIKINLQTKIKEGAIDKVELYVDGKKILSSINLFNSIILKTAEFGVGKHIIKIAATKKDGSSGENYIDLTVTSDTKPIQYSYNIIETYPHEKSHFTQGLEFHNNILYEGTGQEGASEIFQVNLKTGQVLKEYKLENKYFGEGITILNNKIYQLTYKNKIGFIYDLDTFKLLNTWQYKSEEGWGLTNNGQSLIMSDGTENIYFINPITFQEERRIQVCNDHNVVKNINELEYIKGEIWANIWQTDTIIVIDPNSGKITGEIDMSGLSGSIMEKQSEQIDVLNGIAWNPLSDKIYVTGKLWPKLFEIKLKKIKN